MIKKTNRIKEIDILYSIGAILAIFGHSHPNSWPVFEGTIFWHSIVFIYTFHMALFFFVAGVLLNKSKSLESKPFYTFIKEKALKLLTPYFILTFLTIIPKGYLEYGNLSFLNVKFIVESIFNPRNNTWGHFWFLPVLFICYIIFGLLKKLICKFCSTTQIYILLGCSIIFGILVLYPPIKTDWMGVNDIFKFAFYIPFGMLLTYLNHIPRKTQTRTFLPIVCFALLFVASVVIYRLFYNIEFARFIISLLMIFCLLALAYTLKDKCENIFGFLSNNVFSIYIYSWPFQSVVLIILERLGFSWQLCAPIMFVAGIICPLIIIAIYKKSKKLNCHFLDLILGIR